MRRGIGSDLRFGTPDPGPVWGPDGADIYFITGEVLHSSVYKVNLDSRKVEQITAGVSVDGFSYSSDFHVLAYNAMTATEPCELYVGGKKVTWFNDKHLKSLWLSKPEQYTWVNEKAESIDGWVMKPIGFKEGKIPDHPPDTRWTLSHLWGRHLSGVPAADLGGLCGDLH